LIREPRNIYTCFRCSGRVNQSTLCRSKWLYLANSHSPQYNANPPKLSIYYWHKQDGHRLGAIVLSAQRLVPTTLLWVSLLIVK